MSSTAVKTSRLGLVLPVACLGLALGFAGPTHAQQAPGATGCPSGPTPQAQQTQGLPPSVQDRAQRARASANAPCG